MMEKDMNGVKLIRRNYIVISKDELVKLVVEHICRIDPNFKMGEIETITLGYNTGLTIYFDEVK